MCANPVRTYTIMLVAQVCVVAVQFIFVLLWRSDAVWLTNVLMLMMNYWMLYQCVIARRETIEMCRELPPELFLW